jgi:hypothetical protein
VRVGRALGAALTRLGLGGEARLDLGGGLRVLRLRQLGLLQRRDLERHVVALRRQRLLAGDARALNLLLLGRRLSHLHGGLSQRGRKGEGGGGNGDGME